MSLNASQTLALALDPTLLFELRGWTPDPWQRELLRSNAPRMLLNCCRQAGKSTAVAALALHTALFHPKSLVLLVSRSLRQSSELFRKVVEFDQCVRSQGVKIADIAARSALRLELTNDSRIISLPGREGALRGYSGASLLIIDEAARVSPGLYREVRPMLAVSSGRLILLSTPFGRRGFFYRAWMDSNARWLRFQVRAEQVPRISRAFLDEELREHGPSSFNQEYGCSFEAREGLVYPDFAECVVQQLPAELRIDRRAFADKGIWDSLSSAFHSSSSSPLRLLGGIDFGFRNPFAAVWGVLDQRDVLWIFGEYYERQAPLSQHAAQLPRSVCWYADPAEPGEIAELRRGDFVVRKGNNPIQLGIAAVTARIQTGRLKVLADACPHLLAESQLYCYPERAEPGVDPEKPIDAHNHALGALRYLIASHDRRFMVRLRRSASNENESGEGGEPRQDPPPNKGQKWLSIYNEALWTPLNY